MKLTLRYGKQGLSVTLPGFRRREVLRLRPLPRRADVSADAAAMLREPLGSAPLAEIARGRRRACVLVPDITRPLPGRLLLPPLLETLERAGLARERILLLIATGLHREATEADLLELLGPEVLAAGYPIASHQARDREAHELVGHSRFGTPLWLDRRYLEADLRVLVSLIEPHLFAGYSGGRKMILPGIAAAESICRFHGPAMIEHEKLEMGRVGDNPADQEAWDGYHAAGGADFAMACTLDESRRVTGVWAGETRAVQIAGMSTAEQSAKLVLEAPADVVLTSNAGYPLDLTFYQGLKAIEVGGKICRDGGVVLVAQENREGLGSPEFADLALSVDNCHHWVAEALERGGEHAVDGWAVHQMEQVFRRCRVWSYSTVPPDLQRRLGVEPLSGVEEGLERALAELGPEATLAVIPEGPYVLPCLRAEYVAEHTVTEMMAGGVDSPPAQRLS